jgi:hypothetical protein
LNSVLKGAQKMSKTNIFAVMASQAWGLSYETPTAFAQWTLSKLQYSKMEHWANARDMRTSTPIDLEDSSLMVQFIRILWILFGDFIGYRWEVVAYSLSRSIKTFQIYSFTYNIS